MTTKHWVVAVLACVLAFGPALASDNSKSKIDPKKLIDEIDNQPVDSTLQALQAKLAQQQAALAAAQSSLQQAQSTLASLQAFMNAMLGVSIPRQSRGL